MKQPGNKWTIGREDVALWCFLVLVFFFLRGALEWMTYGRVRWAQTIGWAVILPSLMLLGTCFRRWKDK